jgi:ribosomal protein S19E (S16A)
MDSSWRPKRIYSVERVIHTRVGQKHRFFYVEAEEYAPASKFTTAQKQLSRKAIQHLRRDGMVRNSDVAKELIRFCSKT